MSDAELDKRIHGHPDEELVGALEPDQLVAATSRRLPRYALSRATSFWLWALRIFVMIITLLVVYTFVASLGVPTQGP